MSIIIHSLSTPSKWFLKKVGHSGLNNLLAAYEDKSASAQCTFAFSEGPGREVQLFVGKTPVSGPLKSHDLCYIVT